MNLKGFSLVIFLMVMAGWHFSALAQDKPETGNTDAAEEKVDEQFEIIKNALLKGDSESIRVKAATVMLTDTRPAARKILLDTLSQTQNSAARVAICKALTQAEAERKSVPDRENFIEPLLNMLATGSGDEAAVAAVATTIFNYDQLQEPLEKMVSDPASEVKPRLNMIQCLSLHPDMRAAIKLIQLVDDPEPKVSAAAARTLNLLEIDVGADPDARAATIKRLVAEGPELFLKKRLMNQEAARRKLQSELEHWRGEYLAALGKVYESLEDDAAKGAFLGENLKSPESMVRLWALEQVARGRRSTTKAKISGELGQIIIGLVSDPDRDVRLAVAKLLSRMGELDSARQLLAQLKKESDDAVEMELFSALGGACYYASLPNSGIKVPKEVRKETLDWAVKYLGGKDPVKAREGADVLRKLLEQNGFTGTEVKTYLTSLSNRYRQEKESSNEVLRAELISAMAGLCGQRSLSRAPAAAMYKPIFEEALSDSSQAVRLGAMDGLIQIDSGAALARFRKELLSDPSLAVRLKLAELAGSIGSAEDLDWLAGKIGSDGESEASWQAMLKIFSRSGAAVVSQWLKKIDDGALKVNQEQLIALLEIAEQKAVAEKDDAMAMAARRRLAAGYRGVDNFERAAEYLLKLRQTSQGQEKDRIDGQLLETYLSGSKPELAVGLIKGRLAQGDIDPEGMFADFIAAFLDNPPDGADPDALLVELSRIKTEADDRPKWQALLKRWVEQYTKAKEPETSKVSGS